MMRGLWVTSTASAERAAVASTAAYNQAQISARLAAHAPNSVAASAMGSRWQQVWRTVPVMVENIRRF